MSSAIAQRRSCTAIQIFVFHNDRFVGTELFDGQASVVIGRHSESDLQLESETVSRRHCRLLELNGTIAVEDLGSGNGTLINRNRLEGRSVLRERDVLRVGPFGLRAKLLQAADSPPIDGVGEETTKILAILEAEQTQDSNELGVELSDMFDQQLYEAALRRTTGDEDPQPAEADTAEPRQPSLLETEVGASSAKPLASPAESSSVKLKNASLDPEVHERLRDLDELIAALDAEERGEASIVPWRVDNHTLDRADRPSSGTETPANVIPMRPIVEARTPVTSGDAEDVGSETEVMEHARVPVASDEDPSISGTAELVDSALFEEVWTQQPPTDPPPVGLPSSEWETLSKVRVQEAPQYDGIEVSARTQEGLLDIAVLRRPGDQYILGHRTPQGAIAPVRTHQGLRLVRVNRDRSVDLVFPMDVAGDLQRGKTRVELQTLAEGRKYSCLRLEPKDEVTARLGPATDPITYHIRFLKQPGSLFRSLRGRRDH